MSSAPIDADVLIVEDDPLAAKLLGAIIKRMTGRSVQVIDDATAAMDALRRAASGEGGRLPDLLIADIHLGVENSFALVGWVRCCAHTQSVRLLMITADDRDLTRDAALNAGAEFVMSKGDFLDKTAFWMEEFFPEQAASA